MKLRIFTSILMQFLAFTCYSYILAQDPPPPGIPSPQQEEADHTGANEKLAKEIQKAIDALNELKDADKIEILKKIKKHIEDNKKVEPAKNIDDAIKKTLKKGEATPQWLDNLARGWKKSLGIQSDPPNKGWKELEQNLRVSRILLEPIIYEAGPAIDPYVHAYFTIESTPGDELEYMNARFSDPATGTSLWLVENIPLPASNEQDIISYKINVESFGPAYDFLTCEYTVSTTWQTDPQFPAMGSADMVPQPTVYYVLSGSDDPTLQIDGVIPVPPILLTGPKAPDVLRRDKDFPNVDLDNANRYPDDHPVPNDINACGPASAANSLTWLEKQHPELKGDTTCLRSKLDSLKKYMNLGKKDPDGVRFDSMVVGKLTFIDKHQLPIRVKYKTKHISGNVKVPLASTEEPKHTPDNLGKLDVPPDFEWFKKEMDDGEDVEVQVGWYGPPDKDGKRKRAGGHWITATGYFSAPFKKGIYAADDNDQLKKGGLRDEYYKWGKLADGQPYLEGMTDAKGNIAVIESVVSESYDPTVRFNEVVSNPITPPWDKVDLTAVEMKPLYAAVIPVKNGFPIIPLIGGVVGAGVLVYILTQDNTGDDCSFTATALPSPASCGLENGQVVISSSVEATYQWSNGATSKDLVDVAAGNYSVTITRTGTSCTQILQATVANVDLTINTTISTMDASCGQSNGSAITSVDPPGTYTYLWSNGSTNSLLENVPPGTYTLTVTGAGTCQSVSTTTIGELPSDLSITITSIPANCGMQDGEATVTVDPPGEYTYLWSNGQTTSQLTGVNTGNYSLTVTIASTHCSSTSSVTIDELPPAFVITTTTTPSACGSSDGTATVTVDPPGTYTYAWSEGQNTSQAVALAAGLYTVTVTLSGTSCSQSIEVDIDELPAAFTVSTTSTPSGCGQPTGTATAMADPPAEYIYQWSNGLVGEQVSNLAPGQYIVSVSVTGSSCVVTDTIVVEQIMPSFTGTITTVPADCGLSNGSALIIIDPIGSYTYSWSNQQTGPELQNVMAGQYEVTVTDANSCTATFSAEIPQDAAEYIEITATTPATCIGGGEIAFTLYTPGSGMLQVEMVSPEGSSSQLLPPGSYLLSSFINIVPGTYSLTVFDQGIGPACSENIAIAIDDQTPALSVMDDTYSTTGENPVNENMLNNDSGLNLEVSSVSNAIGGTVVFNSNGVFTYTPDPGFVGNGSFTYTVTDACGTTGSGTVIITVEMVNCNFTITTTLIPSHCGLSDGYINIEVNEPGSYAFSWNTGDTGPELIDVPADVYSVTIEDTDLGCFLEFEIELPEYPAEYIDNVVVTQPTCSTPGEIQFDVTAPEAQDVLTMEVTHPNGTNVFSIDPGNVLLRDYVAIVPGTYTIDVYIGNVGSECFDEFTVTLIMPPSLQIEVEAVFPPSSPPAMDGSATIVAIVPGSLPYTVYVDGLPMATANANTFTVGGMGVGMHTIQIEDANGCLSNILNVLIPFPDIILSIGTAFSSFSFNPALPEAANIPSGEVISSGLLADVKYHMGTIPQHATILFVPFRIYSPPHSGYLIEVQHRSQLGSIDKKKFRLILEGGIGMKVWSSSFENPVSPFLELNGTGSFSLGNKIHVETELGFKGWRYLHEPFWKIILSFPFVH